MTTTTDTTTKIDDDDARFRDKVDELTTELAAVINKDKWDVTCIVHGLILMFGHLLIAIPTLEARKDLRGAIEMLLPDALDSAMTHAKEKYEEVQKPRTTTRELNIPSLFILPPEAPPLMKDLVLRILRAAHEGIGDGGDCERENRALACFLVLCSLLAVIEDDDIRDSLISRLSKMARHNVMMTYKTASKVASDLAGSGMTMNDIFEKAHAEGLTEEFPDKSAEH